VAGKRAYDLARAGREVSLAPRPVMIHALRVRVFAYPELVLEIECGSGTYVRSLGRDLAERLGTAAVMSALVRTAIGEFRLEEACSAEALTPGNLDRYLLPMARGVTGLPSLVINADEARRLQNGLPIERAEAATEGEWAAFDAAGRLCSILAPRDSGLARRGFGLLHPVRNFPQAAS
jgi:tRNA pseudouridine55 synthase